MRPLRPLFNRHSSADDLERDAERLKNRDWVEILRVVHPSQAESAEREYLLARLSQDWTELTSPLLATHSLPQSLNGKNLMVACDHNTFANELTLIGPAVEKKIAARYGITLKILARATRKIDWQGVGKGGVAAKPEVPAEAKADIRKAGNSVIEKLIGEISRL